MPLAEGAEEQMESLAKDFLRQARNRTPEQYQQAVERLTEWAQDTRRQFGQYDVVLTPVLAFTPPPIGTFSAKTPNKIMSISVNSRPILP